MKKYYCHECAEKKGYFSRFYIDDILTRPSTYQLDKYIKHTIPSTCYSKNSVFIDASSDLYAKYMVDTFNAGSIEIDDKDRINYIYYAGEPTGFLINGRNELPTDSIKVVLSSDPSKTHQFPIGSSSFSTGICYCCGKSILS